MNFSVLLGHVGLLKLKLNLIHMMNIQCYFVNKYLIIGVRFDAYELICFFKFGLMIETTNLYGDRHH